MENPSQAWQEWVALSVVACVAAGLLWRGLRGWIAPPVAQWLLNRGQVKWAMRVRGWSGKGSCH